MSIDARTTNGLTDFFYLLEIAAQDLCTITFFLPQRLYQLGTETVCIPKVSKSKSHCTLKVLMYFCLVAKVVWWFLKAAKKKQQLSSHTELAVHKCRSVLMFCSTLDGFYEAADVCLLWLQSQTIIKGTTVFGISKYCPKIMMPYR